MPDKTPAQLLEGYAEFADARRQEWLVPGCAVAIVKDGNVVFSRGFGMRDVANNLPVTPDTVFAIGSCTKAFTCTALGMLADAGKLDWDKPVRDYVPEFRLYDSFATERMTARDLVTHRSGLPRHDLLWYGGKFSRQDMFSRLRYLEPSKDFRAVFQYNNLMYMAAGVLIERLAGCTWEEFIRQRFFGPLGMAHSNTSVTVSPTLDDFAKPYDKVKDKEEVKQIPFRNIDAIGPAGAINSSVSDMAHWLLLNLNKGKQGDKQLVSQAMLQQIYAPVMVMGGAPDDDPEIGQTTYGLGWAIYSYRGHHMIQHGGGIDGFLSQVTLLPRENIGIVALTNLTPSALCPVLTHNALDRLLGLDEVDWSKRYKEREAKAKEAQAQGEAHGAQKPESGRKLDTEPSHRLDDYVGEYEHPGYGRATVAWRDGQLSLASSGIEMPLKHFHYDVFEARYNHLDMTVKVTFGVDADGLVSTLSAPLEPAVKPVVFTRVPSEALTDRARLEQFVGEYELMGMLASISLLGDHALLATVPGQPAQELAPVEGDRFKLKAIEGISLEFKRNEQGAVVELVFQQPNGSFVAKRK